MLFYPDSEVIPLALGTVVGVSSLVALLSDVVFTFVAYCIGRGSRLPDVKVNKKKYKLWYYFVR
jgi:hypothetical protein